MKQKKYTLLAVNGRAALVGDRLGLLYTVPTSLVMDWGERRFLHSDYDLPIMVFYPVVRIPVIEPIPVVPLTEPLPDTIALRYREIELYHVGHTELGLEARCAFDRVTSKWYLLDERGNRW